MAKVILDISMSLDGFIAGPNDDVEPLHTWAFSGGIPSTHIAFGRFSSGESAQVFDKLIESTGAIITGRRTYDLSDGGGWGGNHPFPGVPVFVITHDAPSQVPQGWTPFTFVTDGVESAAKQAKAAAGEKNVYLLGGASIAKQCFEAGLIDEITIHLAPVLLADGMRLFENPGQAYINLEQTRVVETPEVTHLSFRVPNHA